MMNVHGLRRNVKNVVRNYSDAQVKVREATSNDPWGPPSTLMGEIADLSYNVVAFTEIMQMIWKRLNDHGKNWRHVYKALVLLEYLIKTGSEKVSQQCKENIFAIQTLKDFQHTEDNKDQGVNVREKSKQLVALLKDDERLRAERTRALKAKERFAQATARVGSEALAKYGSSSRRDSYNSDATSPRGEDLSPGEGDGASGLSSELECARPQTAGEEELQLQLALAMSKEEAEQEERLRKHDDLRLQMAINESQHTTAAMPNGGASSSGAGPSSSHHQAAAASGLDDLLGLNLGAAGGPSGAEPPSVTDPWGMPLYDGAQAAAPDPWSSPTGSRPATVGQPSDPWQSPTSKPANHGDPWSASQDPWRSPAGGPTTNGNDLDEFDTLSKRSAATSPISEQTGAVGDALALGGLRRALPSAEEDELSKRKTPESFLGPNSNLVNLDALVTTRPAGTLGVAPSTAANPFAAPLSAPTTGLAAPGAAAAAAASNPFQASKPPTINQLRLQNNSFPATPVAPVTTTTLLTHPAAAAALVPQQPLAPHAGYVGMPAGATAVGQQNPFL
ncbi:epsin-2 isoform X1 [Rhipicephalus sanguineus]|uniref:epsin-2 isoform X1 n=1 Tax=Rhipicephalus sanguineus TaxID=34632 RepID=UPI001895D0D4|nr:epsin-2 isoform X1 [Rhipicephalus sanguineus]XP_049273911.1 epsin-2 isoform X1 [Rhipicephalus sanguineus]XP_049273912.1 epsin-2 isoform X1 [Rhipicephalus sanguineus]